MSVKNKTSGRRSMQSRAGVVDDMQPSVKRRSTESQVRTIINSYAPTQLRLIVAMRRLLRKRLPTAHEIVYAYHNLGAVVISFSPSEHGYEGVLAIRGNKDGVKLYFNQGITLSDPEKLLRGSAKARWIQVERASTLTRTAVVSLIDEAIARNRVPFTLEGSGLVVIRAASGK